MIRIVAQGVFSIDQLKKFAYSPSEYYNGQVEGIYVRCFDSNNKLKYRGKIVRHDFITPGTSHWSKIDIIKNIIV